MTEPKLTPETAMPVSAAREGQKKGGVKRWAITLLKVVLVDLSGAGTGWRILSFIGLGALLLVTSVLYGKFGPALIGHWDHDDADRREDG